MDTRQLHSLEVKPIVASTDRRVKVRQLRPRKLLSRAQLRSTADWEVHSRKISISIIDFHFFGFHSSIQYTDVFRRTRILNRQRKKQKKKSIKNRGLDRKSQASFSSFRAESSPSQVSLVHSPVVIQKTSQYTWQPAQDLQSHNTFFRL